MRTGALTRSPAKYLQEISMKIVAVKTAVVEANYDYTYVRVYADSEEYGTGECFFAPGLTAIIRELAPVLVGKDPRALVYLMPADWVESPWPRRRRASRYWPAGITNL